jgi:hypothetical protein
LGREHLVADTVRIAPIRHRIGKPPANAEVAFRVPLEQQTPIRGLVAATKIYREFLAPDS